MIASGLFSLLTASFLFLAFIIFLVQVLIQVRRREKLTKSFSLLMTVFMLAWSLSELLEETSGPPYDISAQYIHFIVMILFAGAITWRWRWASQETGLRRR